MGDLDLGQPFGLGPVVSGGDLDQLRHVAEQHHGLVLDLIEAGSRGLLADIRRQLN